MIACKYRRISLAPWERTRAATHVDPCSSSPACNLSLVLETGCEAVMRYRRRYAPDKRTLTHGCSSTPPSPLYVSKSSRAPALARARDCFTGVQGVGSYGGRASARPPDASHHTRMIRNQRSRARLSSSEVTTTGAAHAGTLLTGGHHRLVGTTQQWQRRACSAIHVSRFATTGSMVCGTKRLAVSTRCGMQYRCERWRC